MTRARDMANIAAGSFSIPSGSLTNATPAAGSITNAMLASNAITSASLPSGTVLQVVQTYKTDASSYAGSGVYHTVMSANITPISTNSKVFISTDLSYSYQSGQLQYEWLFYFDRTIAGGSAIKIGAADAAGSRETGAFQPTSLSSGSADDHVALGTISNSFLDAPLTTSQITYALKFRSHGNTFYVNRSRTDYDGTGFSKRLTSNFTLMEIAG